MIRIKQTAAPPPNGDPLEFVMSDGSVDRMGDVIEPAGWWLDNFRQNPVALFSHDARFPIGKWAGVAVRDGQLTGRLDLLDPVSIGSAEIRAAVDAGVLRAVSVGFHPNKYERSRAQRSAACILSSRSSSSARSSACQQMPMPWRWRRPWEYPRRTRLIFGVLSRSDQALQRHQVHRRQPERKPHSESSNR
jgi:hypothetical protein